MRNKRPHYAAEFRRQMVELVRAGRSPAELANEFEPTAQSIHKWVARADRDEGRRSDGLTTPEREELNRLRRENRQLKVEREILEMSPQVSLGAAADLDRPCARRRARCAGRDGGTGSAGAEQRNWTKQEDTMPSDQIP